MERCILHCDMNNFYASVECMLNPSIKNLPVAVCGDVEMRRGVVLAKNYKAKEYGVQTGEPVWQAKKKCNCLVTVPPHFEKYDEISKKARKIYESYTDMVEPFGLDECWLDVTGSQKLFGSGEEIAHKIREQIKSELGVTVSVGVSFNKVFAKLGSDLKKPDAVTVISPLSFRQQIWNLPASDMLGVGKKTGVALKSMGVMTIGDLANIPVTYLKNKFGKCGEELHARANGKDSSPVVPCELNYVDKSIGHGITTAKDLTSNAEVYSCMLELCEDIGHRLYKYNKKATGVAISIKDNKLYSFSRQTKLPQPTSSHTYIAQVGYDLFLKNYSWDKNVRAVSVRAIDLVDEDAPCQLDIFADVSKIIKLENIDRTVEELKEQFGSGVIKRCNLLTPSVSHSKNWTGFASE